MKNLSEEILKLIGQPTHKYTKYFNSDPFDLKKKRAKEVYSFTKLNCEI